MIETKSSGLVYVSYGGAWNKKTAAEKFLGQLFGVKQDLKNND